MKANKLSIWIVEILSKWKAIKINQSEIDSIASVYKERVNYIIATRDNVRTPDKEDEERKYRYLEGVKAHSQVSVKNENIINDITPRWLFPAEDQTVDDIPMSHSLKFYVGKLAEINKIVSDK